VIILGIFKNSLINFGNCIMGHPLTYQATTTIATTTTTTAAAAAAATRP
jgi:hypothetical protein